ncbi:MAG: aldo/keto reductase [Proteobacteria bacterium]|nr:aldo/keto reductase [Pseudomonadota bacterium]
MKDQKWLTTSAGVKMPWIIYGTAWKKERTADLVVKAVQAGFRGIDTAGQPKHYDEAGIGAALLRLKKDYGIEREELYLQTKFTPLPGHDPEQVPYDKNATVEVQVLQSFETSMKKLQTEYVDTLLLHTMIEPYPLLMKVWEAMESIQQSGRARQIGISNFYYIYMVKKLYADANIKPAVLQNRFYKDTGYDPELRSWCSDNGVIYQSFWTLTANRYILFDNIVQTLARKHNKTDAQIFFRYLNQSGIVPLTGTTSDQHMAEDLNVFDFKLSPGDLKNVSSLLSVKDIITPQAGIIL